MVPFQVVIADRAGWGTAGRQHRICSLVVKVEPGQARPGVGLGVDRRRRWCTTRKRRIVLGRNEDDPGLAMVVEVPRLEAVRVGVDLLPHSATGTQSHHVRLGHLGCCKPDRTWPNWRWLIGEAAWPGFKGDEADTTPLG